MFLESLLILALFHHKPKPKDDPAKDDQIKAGIEVVVSAGNLVATIESKSDNVRFLQVSDLIEKSKSEIKDCMNAKTIDEFNQDIDRLTSTVDKLVSVDTDLDSQDLI